MVVGGTCSVAADEVGVVDSGVRVVVGAGIVAVGKVAVCVA